jgi:hypothetical protein
LPTTMPMKKELASQMSAIFKIMSKMVTF